MTIEHMEARSARPEKTNDYENCLYVCRYCNRARSDLPRVNDEGARLLSPSDVIWEKHFRVEGDRLVPLPGDVDAEYTVYAYDLNAKRKCVTRRRRQEVIESLVKVLREGPAERQKMLRVADKAILSGNMEDAVFLNDAAEMGRKQIVEAWRRLERYRAVAEDCDSACQCRPAIPLVLPVALREQILNLTPPREVLEYIGADESAASEDPAARRHSRKTASGVSK